jgi:outer membrane receptor protein involved in Fe transport
MYLDITAKDGGVRIPTVGNTDHWSAYALLEWQATDAVKVSIEDRYVDEEFDALLSIGSTCSNFYPYTGPDPTQPVNTDPNSPAFNFGCKVSLSKQESGTEKTTYQTPKLTVEWKASPDVMFYASAAKGEKPGGVSLLTVAAPIPQPFSSFVFKPEKMWSYELGAKTAWAGDFGRVIFNVAGFRQDYSDKQAGRIIVDPVFNFPVAVVSNASSARVFGSEVEAAWATPIEGLDVDLAYTWLDTEYDDYKDRSRSATTIALQGECPEITQDELGSSYCTVDYTENQLEYAPEHSLVANLSFRRPFKDTGADYLLEMDARFHDEVFTNVANFTTLDAYWLVDLRAGLVGENWQFIAFLNNVLDDDTIRNLGSNPDFPAWIDTGPGQPPLPFATTTTLPEPRVFGVRLSRKF